MVGISLDRIYIRKLLKINGFKVWIVDGKYIRDNIEEEFTNYAQHYKFRFIPQDEFWIDKERTPGEEKYFIDSMLLMNRLMLSGVSHEEAVRRVNRLEKRERSKSKLMEEGLAIKKNKEKLLKSIHKNIIPKYSYGRIKVWVVKGELVRDLFFVDFTQGGHGKVYNFIPKNEIWIDDDLDFAERDFVLLHELHEMNLMNKGKDYDSAHKSSSKIEYYCRRHPKKIVRYLKREFKKAERMKI